LGAESVPEWAAGLLENVPSLKPSRSGSRTTSRFVMVLRHRVAPTGNCPFGCPIRLEGIDFCPL